MASNSVVPKYPAEASCTGAGLRTNTCNGLLSEWPDKSVNYRCGWPKGYQKDHRQKFLKHPYKYLQRLCDLNSKCSQFQFLLSA